MTDETTPIGKRRIRAEIHRESGGVGRATRTKLSAGDCWRIVEALGGDTPKVWKRHARDTPNEPTARAWIAEYFGFGYDPAGRLRPFRTAELVEIRDALREDAADD